MKIKLGPNFINSFKRLLSYERKVDFINNWLPLSRNLKIKSLQFYGFVEYDYLLLHAPFQVLCDFVEKDEPFSGNIDWEYDEEHREAKKEILALYLWWTQTYPERKDHPEYESFNYEEIPEIGSEDDSTSWHRVCVLQEELEDFWREEESSMLHRLIEIRRWLWT